MFATPASLGNGVTWELDGTTLTIGYTGSGSGVMPTYSSGSDASRPWNSDKASITNIVVEEGITVIGAYAFHGCSAATTLSLPSTLDSIGLNVFINLNTSCATTFHGTVEQWCNIGLRDYDSNPFYHGDGQFRTDAGIITKINIPQGITKITPSLFRRTTITELTIPTSVTVIGAHAFRDCSSLASVTFTATSKVDSIATYAFASCSALTTLTIPSSVRIIETYAFQNCSKLTSIDFNNATKLKTIGNNAFQGTTKLTMLSLRGATSLVTIGNNAFSLTSGDATAKSYLYLPASLRTIGTNAFNNRTGLEGIVIMNTSPTDANLTKCAGTTSFNNVTKSIPVYVNSSTLATTYGSLTGWSSFTNFTYTNEVTFNCGTPTASALVAHLNIRTGALTFTGSGDMKDYTSTKADWRLDVYKSVLKSVTISKMSRIGAYAFYNCDNLTGSISIPNTVVSIGNRAFYGCKGLTGLTLSSASKLETIDQYAFYNCSAITSSFSATSWGGKVSTIGNYAFSGCGLTSVALPSTLTSLGNYAFQGNKSLTKADFSAATSLTTFGTSMFAGCSALSNVTLQSTLTALPDRTFSACSSLKTVSLPESVASVSYLAFASSGIKTIIANRSTTPTLSSAMSYIRPDTVRLAVFTAAAKTAYKAHTYWGQFDVDTKIEGECGAEGDNVTYALDLATGVLTLTGTGATATYSSSDANRAPWYAFRSLITSVEVGSGITGIGGYAFKDCSNMTTISLPASLTTMGSSIFDGCTGLTSYTYAGTIAQWLGITFSGTSSTPMYHVKKFYANGSDTEITDLVIPNGTTEIKQYSFYNCQGLESVTLPASLTSVGTSAFSTCTHIENTNYLGTIDQWCSIAFVSNVSNPAFFSKQLSINGDEQTDIYLSDDLTEIKNYVFESNEALLSVSVKNTTTIQADAFKNCDAIITVRGELSGTCGTGLTWSLEDGVLTITYSSGTGVMDDYTSSKAPWYVYRKSINKIIVGEGVTQVSKYAFRGMTQTFGVYLPSTLTQIGDYGFYESSGLAYIVCKATTPPSIPAHQAGYSSYESGTFNSVATDIPVYVPSGSQSAYESAMTITYSTSTGWARFTNYIPTIVFTGNCGTTGHESEVTWTYDPADRSMIISGSGDMKDYNSSSAAPWNTLKPLIAAVVIEDGVTKGGKYTFDNCTALTSITIATSCTSFGMQIFGGCTSLTEVVLPEGITSTGSWMFHGCTNLVDVTLPSTLTEVDVRSFSQTGITSMDIPEGVTNIDNYAFYQCTSLASIDLPSTLTRINSNAFDGCSTLASIDLPEGLTNIGSKAFAGCSELTTITIPRSVTTVTTTSGSYTFNGCSKLRTVNWNAEACADFNKYSSGSGFTYYTPFGDAKTTITTINFGEHVRIIPSCLCQGMTGITSVTLPASLEQIHQDAFNGCTGLTSITIPAKVSVIQGTVFEGCTDIDEITAYPETLPTMGTNVWNNVPTSATVTVMCPTTETAYKVNANWSRFNTDWNHIYGACGELEISTDQAMTEAAPSGFHGDIIVEDGATFTMDDVSALTVDIKDLILEPGARIELASDATYDIDNLIMQRSGDSSDDKVATAEIKGSLTADNLIMDFELDDSRWFTISLPQTVAANAVTDADDGTALVPDEDYYALSFDGEQRAEYSTVENNWEWVTSGDLNAGEGYLIGLPDGAGTKTLRFTMPSYTYAETSNKTIAVSEYASDKPIDAGWNMVGNPFLQNYHHTTTAMTVGDKTLTAVVTLDFDGARIEYNEELVADAVLPPFSAMFVQAPTTGSLVFTAASARKNIRARYPNNSEPQFLSITLSGNGGKDITRIMTGEYSNEYTIGADMVKWFNEGYTLQTAPTLYTLKSDYKQAINARSAEMLEAIPVGYHATQEGTYTFTLGNDEAEAFEHVLLHDSELEITTDLKLADYAFTSAAGTTDNRFTLTATLANEQVVTGVDIVDSQKSKVESVQKILRDGQLYILRGDKTYTVIGQTVE